MSPVLPFSLYGKLTYMQQALMAAVEFNFYYHKFEILPFAKMGENSTGSMLKPLAYLFSFLQRKCSFSTRAQRTLEIILKSIKCM